MKNCIIIMEAAKSRICSVGPVGLRPKKAYGTIPVQRLADWRPKRTNATDKF